MKNLLQAVWGVVVVGVVVGLVVLKITADQQKNNSPPYQGPPEIGGFGSNKPGPAPRMPQFSQQIEQLPPRGPSWREVREQLQSQKVEVAPMPHEKLEVAPKQPEQ